MQADLTAWEKLFQAIFGGISKTDVNQADQFCFATVARNPQQRDS